MHLESAAHREPPRVADGLNFVLRFPAHRNSIQRHASSSPGGGFRDKKKNGAPIRGAILQNRMDTLLWAGQRRMRKCGFIRKTKCPVYRIGRCSHFEPLQ